MVVKNTVRKDGPPVNHMSPGVSASGNQADWPPKERGGINLRKRENGCSPTVTHGVS